LKELDHRGVKAVIPPKAKRKVQRIFDRCMYKWRHFIENYFENWKNSNVLPCVVIK